MAQEQDRTPAQVAQAWKFQHPAVASLLIHPQTVVTLEKCIAALDMTLSGDQIARLNEPSDPGAEDTHG